jgi:NADP-dependent 3-hydroxy acid dehydrogenase YdfG
VESHGSLSKSGHAAGSELEPIADEDWDMTVVVNQKARLLVTQTIARAMREAGGGPM